jgi:predicted DNA-binding antitoxin AbrB/MazE fold protein
MSTNIRARVRNGRLEPLEAVELPEGADVDITPRGSRTAASFASSAAS